MVVSDSHEMISFLELDLTVFILFYLNEQFAELQGDGDSTIS